MSALLLWGKMKLRYVVCKSYTQTQFKKKKLCAKVCWRHLGDVLLQNNKSCKMSIILRYYIPSEL